MLTADQLIERVAHRQLRQRVQMSLQPGTLNAIVASEISAGISAALNAQLVAERDEALSRDPYERVAGSLKRNGFKPARLPGLWGRMTLHRPVVRAGTLRLGLLEALKTGGKRLRDVPAFFGPNPPPSRGALPATLSEQTPPASRTITRHPFGGDPATAG